MPCLSYAYGCESTFWESTFELAHFSWKYLHVWEPTACASMVSVINLERKGFLIKGLLRVHMSLAVNLQKRYSSNTSNSNAHIMLLLLMNNKVSKNKVLVNTKCMTITKVKLSEHHIKHFQLNNKTECKCNERMIKWEKNIFWSTEMVSNEVC